MKHAIIAGVIGAAIAVGAASAQTAGSSSSTGTAATSGVMTPPMGATNTMSRPAAAAAASPAPAAVSSAANPRTTAAPVSGANSFTQGEAQKQIERKGFTNVADLTKDSNGVWRGKAMKDGKPASVALDYQGNVVGQ